MTARKKPAAKPAAKKPAAKPRSSTKLVPAIEIMPALAAAPAAPPPDAPPAQLKPGEKTALVRQHIDTILSYWSSGLSMRAAIQACRLPVTPHDVQNAIWADEAIWSKWKGVSEYRAQAFIERAAEVAEAMTASGLDRDYRGAAEVFLKLAAKTAPKTFGEKSTVEHTGPGGGPIQQVTSTMTPEEAYKAMLGGAKPGAAK